jgi:hypothetical protein
MRLKLLFCILSVFLFSTAAFSQGVPEKTAWHNNPVDIERINRRLAESAEKYQSYAPIPRMALFDIGYPHNEEEYNQLDGHAILMITALTQNENELPLRRVYVAADGKETDLVSLKSFLSKNSNAKSQVAVVFGVNRIDALYLLPVYFRLRQSEIFAEFSNYSKPLKIASFDGQAAAAIKALPNKAPTGKGFSKTFLETFLKREYPAFTNIEKPKN